MRKAILTGILFLNAAAAQTPTVTAVSNGASFDKSLSPGVLAAVFGTNFGTVAGALTVTVGTKQASVLAATASQLLVQIPVDVSPGATTLVVSRQGSAGSNPFSLTLNSFSPGILSADLTGKGTASAFNAVTFQIINAQNPAKPGDIVGLNAVGLGPTNPPVATGASGPTPAAVTTTIPTATVAGEQAPVIFSGLQPKGMGVYQVYIKIPDDLSSGDQPVVLQIGGSSSNTVTLPILAPPVPPTITSVVNGASLSAAAGIAPGSLVTILGSGFGSQNSGVSVTVNGIAAPLFNVSTSRINLLAPFELPTSGAVPVQVSTAVGTSSAFLLNMSPAAPGIFRVADPSNAQRQNAAALFLDTAWQVIPVSMANALKIPTGCRGGGVSPAAACGQPAQPGDVVEVYATGLGLATPGGDPAGTPLATGSVAPADGSVVYQTVQTPAVTIGGAPAQVLSSVIVPGLAGFYQIDVQIPASAAAGDDVQITLSLAGSTTDSATIAIAP